MLFTVMWQQIGYISKFTLSYLHILHCFLKSRPTTKQKTQPWFDVFGGFLGVNTPVMANFKVSTRHQVRWGTAVGHDTAFSLYGYLINLIFSNGCAWQLACKIPEDVAIGPRKAIRVSSSTRLFIHQYGGLYAVGIPAIFVWIQIVFCTFHLVLFFHD